ncbi:hypothetical protein XBI1_2800038 [Xenorhabdus bovienii str. Intermedium]|uniref:Uncharacterized protein n=1 Tax=Xenorhabdus bovienii str. Intermedium TaxID=1379677 RepID=A0A077QCM3_XENBV|nr:hypothetical protein XBI1_2800038 [Xenorhabdus bovienii str. Intermedium]
MYRLAAPIRQSMYIMQGWLQAIRGLGLVQQTGFPFDAISEAQYWATHITKCSIKRMGYIRSQNK